MMQVSSIFEEFKKGMDDFENKQESAYFVVDNAKNRVDSIFQAPRIIDEFNVLKGFRPINIKPLWWDYFSINDIDFDALAWEDIVERWEIIDNSRAYIFYRKNTDSGVVFRLINPDLVTHPHDITPGFKEGLIYWEFWLNACGARFIFSKGVVSGIDLYGESFAYGIDISWNYIYRLRSFKNDYVNWTSRWKNHKFLAKIIPFIDSELSRIQVRIDQLNVEYSEAIQDPINPFWELLQTAVNNVNFDQINMIITLYKALKIFFEEWAMSPLGVERIPSREADGWGNNYVRRGDYIRIQWEDKKYTIAAYVNGKYEMLPQEYSIGLGLVLPEK